MDFATMKERGANGGHRLIILSLHDANAVCSCHGWDYQAAGYRSPERIEEEFRWHLVYHGYDQVNVGEEA